jgi:HK97 family phage major capsid protein
VAFLFCSFARHCAPQPGNISVANPTFEQRQLTAQTLVTRCSASVEVSQDSPDFGQQLAQAMSKAMAAELDRAGLAGSGTPPEPRGLINTTGIGSVTGAAISDWSKFVSAVQTLLAAGVPLDVATKNVIFNPYVWAKLENLVTGISGDKTQLGIPRAFEDTNFLVTTQIVDGSPVSTTAVLGDFTQFLMGVRREASIEILKLGDYAGKLVLDFVGYLRGDFVCLRPASFCKITALS